MEGFTMFQKNPSLHIWGKIGKYEGVFSPFP